MFFPCYRGNVLKFYAILLASVPSLPSRKYASDVVYRKYKHLQDQRVHIINIIVIIIRTK